MLLDGGQGAAKTVRTGPAGRSAALGSEDRLPGLQQPFKKEIVLMQAF
jgi:hypothetical protein